jgi:hypothetical protein
MHVLENVSKPSVKKLHYTHRHKKNKRRGRTRGNFESGGMFSPFATHNSKKGSFKTQHMRIFPNTQTLFLPFLSTLEKYTQRQHEHQALRTTKKPREAKQ